MTPTDQPIRVLLADDHRLVACALARLVDSFTGISVVADTSSMDDLLSVLEQTPADVVLVDNALLPTNGARSIATQVADTCPGTRLGVLAMFASNAYIQRLLDNGITGFIHKDADVNELEQMIRRIASGEAVVHPGVPLAAPEILDSPAAPTKRHVAPRPLTPRQTEILALVASGYRTRGIAEHLGLSVKTIETHRAELMRRLGVRHMAGLIQEAIRRGLFTAP